MKLARLLFKPKWQDKDPQVRRAAIASDGDVELLAALPHIAREDADAAVRIAALRRLQDYEAWRERSTGDADGDVRRVARDVYLTLLCSRDEKNPLLPRRIAELETLSSAEMERIAAQAADRELRSAALARVSRQAFIAERSLKDADAGVRVGLLDRIEDATALERIAEAARKTDKNVSRRARERAAELRIGSGNAQAITQRALELCTRMETLMRATGDHVEASNEIERAWAQLPGNVADDIAARYRGARALVERMRIRALHIASPDEKTVPDASVDVELPAPPQAFVASPVSIDLLTSQARFDAALASAAALAQSERETRRARVQELEKLVVRFDAYLEAGDVAAAQTCRNEVVPLAAAVDTLPPALAERLSALLPRHDELRRWQQWASQQRRQAICASIESLAATNPHPDALASRVREAREEWRRLDLAENTDAADAGIARRFNAICHRALKPAKGYFDKRDQLRRQHSDEIENVLRSVAALPDAITDWNAAGNLRRELGVILRSLDDVDPRERTALAKRIKEAVGTLAPRIETHERDVETAKQRLIARATALQTADGRGVARQVQDLQREWTSLGHGQRRTDQRQWQEFRKACDGVFSGLDAARKQRDEQTHAAAQSARQVLADLAALTGENGLSRNDIKSSLRELEVRWQSLERPARELEQQHRKLVDEIESGLRAAARNERFARFHDALATYAAVRSLENGTQPGEGELLRVDRGAASDEMALALAERRARAEARVDSSDADEDHARDLLIELEFIAGLETPEEDRARRMNYQLQRLASHMRERSRDSAEKSLANALARWFAQSPQHESLETRFLRAARAGIASLP